MNLTSPSQVKSWCIENGFHPNKTLGQNFLIDQNALISIVDSGVEKCLRGKDTAAPAVLSLSTGDADSSAGDAESFPLRVLEIGPGMGVLTEEMLKRGCKVTAIEKDPVLAERLEKESKSKVEVEQWWKNLTLLTGDALDFLSQPSTSTFNLTSFDCMISNLPYQAGTRILLELVQARTIPVITALVQTEVAERLAAKEGSKVRGLAGVWAQLDYDVAITRKVSASCFWPRPEIGSSVVRLIRHDRNIGLSVKERDVFHRLTKKAFEHRRKQLGSIFKDMIQSTARAEELSNQDWINLTKGLVQNEDA